MSGYDGVPESEIAALRERAARAEKELAEAHGHARRLERELDSSRADFERDLAAARAQVGRLAGALRKYGAHFTDCDARSAPSKTNRGLCICGYAAALAATPAPAEEIKPTPTREEDGRFALRVCFGFLSTDRMRTLLSCTEDVPSEALQAFCEQWKRTGALPPRKRPLPLRMPRPGKLR